MVKSAQRTIYGTHLQLAQLMGYDYTIKPNTSLNEKFGIMTDYKLGKQQYPTLQYITIGNGSTSLIEPATGYTFNRHSAADAALFNHIPFVIREKYDDLPFDQRVRYRFRKLITLENKEYYVYYLKKIDRVQYKDTFFKVMRLGDNDILSLLDTNTETFLNPRPKTKTEILTTLDDTKYIVMLCKIFLDMNKEDIQELKNVFEVFKINSTVLTEIGLCTGVDLTTDGWGEAVAVQVAFHIDVNIDLSINFNQNKKLSRNIEIGGAEPYYLG